MTVMKRLGRYFLFLSLTFLLTVSVFSVGFYVGNSRSDFAIKYQASASDPVDMTPFWKVWYLLEEKYVDKENAISEEDRLWGAIRGLANSYGDPYTIFLPPEKNEEFNESVGGNFEGVGMEVIIKDGFLTVVSPLKDTPAWKAGIQAGDVILKIDGESAGGLTIDQSISRIRGKKGTDVVLTIAREDEEGSKEISITRGVIEIPTIDTEMKDDDIFVISLYNFNANASRLFKDALREFLESGSDKLVLDLRGNPGGYLNSAVDISSWFLPAGKVVVRENFGEGKAEKIFRSKGYNIFSGDKKLVVLVDVGSASASEIVAGALREHGVGTLVGSRTFGKGSVQELIEVTDDTSLKVTIARWFTPDGVSISENGLTPDVEVEITKEDREAGIDPQMEAALSILKGEYNK